MSTQTLTIGGWLPEQISNGSHGHWSVKQKKLKAAQVMAWASAKQAEWVPLSGRAKLTVVLVFSTQRRRDADNLYSRCKGLVDGLKPWFVDDSTDWLELIVRAEVQPGTKETRLTLESLDAQEQAA